MHPQEMEEVKDEEVEVEGDEMDNWEEVDVVEEGVEEETMEALLC